jgi:hypothetical protein
MTDNYSESDDGLVDNLQKVVITHLKKRGTREQVWNGEAHSTSGGLTRQDLMISNTGKIVSKKASEKSKQLMLDRHAKKDVQTSDELKPSSSASKSKKSTKVEEPPSTSKPKKTPSAVKPKKSKKVQTNDSESDE